MAIAASIALPPARKTSSPASVAIGAEVATMPLAATAAERPGTLKSRIRPLESSKCPPDARLTGGPIALTVLVRHSCMVHRRRSIQDPEPHARTAAFSGHDAACARHSHPDRTRRLVAAHEAALRARSHQSVAPRRRARMDRRRYRVRAA